MSRPDAAASAQLDESYVGPVWYAWLDFVGNEIRACSAGRDVIISGAPDPELNGTYIGIHHRLVEVSSVKVASGGTDTVTVRLSGIPGIDDESLATIGNPANWRGRDARLWRVIRNEAGEQQGGYQAYYTGTMMGCRVVGSPQAQSITITIESYLSILTEASNRSYLDSERYDAGDLSGRAGIAIANGTPIAGINPGSGYGGGGGGIFDPDSRNQLQ